MSRNWSREQIEILRRHYPTGGASYVSTLTGRSAPAVRQKAMMLGIKCKTTCTLRTQAAVAARHNGRSWTPEQVEVLRKHYPAKGSEYVAEITGRTRRAVVRKANDLGIRCLIANRNGARLSAEQIMRRKHEAMLAAFRAASPSERALMIAMAEERRAV